jgi:hypothetical protein
VISPISRLPFPSVGKYLSSWKEIAQYFSRGVRTVQRWEAELGMPVRRPHGGSRTAVMAIREELDTWMTSRPFRNSPLSHRSDTNGHESGHAMEGIHEHELGDVIYILAVEDGTSDGRLDACFMKKLGPRLKVDTVRNLESALSLLKEIDDGTRPEPDLIILDQVLFSTIAHRVFRLCQANSCLRNVQILIRPSIFTPKGMHAA